MSVTCPVPLPGFGPWEHDWRLWTRHWNSSNGFLEQWYCTRCRTMDVRTVPETTAAPSPPSDSPVPEAGLASSNPEAPGAAVQQPRPLCRSRFEGLACRRDDGHSGEHVTWAGLAGGPWVWT